MDARGLLRAGMACSALAGIIHIVNAPEHLAEWWGYGLFFLFASVAQVWFAVGLLALWQEAEPGLDAQLAQGRRGTRDFVLLGLAPRAWFQLGILGNASIVVLYVVTRTVGIPLFGPDAGEVELALIGALALLLGRPQQARSPAASLSGR
jgi:hypothetical protein